MPWIAKWGRGWNLFTISLAALDWATPANRKASANLNLVSRMIRWSANPKSGIWPLVSTSSDSMYWWANVLAVAWSTRDSISWIRSK